MKQSICVHHIDHRHIWRRETDNIEYSILRYSMWDCKQRFYHGRDRKITGTHPERVKLQYRLLHMLKWEHLMYGNKLFYAPHLRHIFNTTFDYILDGYCKLHFILIICCFRLLFESRLSVCSIKIYWGLFQPLIHRLFQIVTYLNIHYPSKVLKQ